MAALNQYCLTIWLLLFSAVCIADPTFLEAKCKLAFPEAMLHLQDTIKNRGYTISRVQHVDKGLHAKGYDSENYKVVFFGKQKQIESIKSDYPQLIPLMPLSITLVEKNKINIISGLRPKKLQGLFNNKVAKEFFDEWEADYQLIFAAFQNCNT